MSFKSIQEDLDKIKEEYDAKVAEIRDQGLSKVFRDFFEENPDIQAVQFIGYIPGFNDGDPCVFGLGEVNFADQTADLNDAPDYEAEEEEGWFNTPRETRYVRNPDYGKVAGANYWLLDDDGRTLKEKDPNYRESLTSVSKFIQSNSDLMNKLFGDNFKVIITKDEIKVEEYDCGY